MQAERSRGRTPGQGRGRTDQRCQIGMDVNSHRSLGSQARIVVGDERSSGKAAEIDDEGQEQDFAAERQAVSGSPKSVQPKDQPTGNGDRTQDKKRKEKRAVRKKRIELVAEHIGRSLVVANYVFSGRQVS
jgi:hypothetical protein